MTSYLITFILFFYEWEQVVSFLVLLLNFSFIVVKGGILGKSLLNKSCSESQALSRKISLASLVQF